MRRITSYNVCYTKLLRVTWPQGVDLWWLLGAIAAGGVIGPYLLMYGLRATDARITSYNVCYTKLLRMREELEVLKKLAGVQTTGVEQREPTSASIVNVVDEEVRPGPFVVIV